MLLVEVAYERDEVLRKPLPYLLHVAVVGMDHQDRQAASHWRSLLQNLIHSLVVRHLPAFESDVCVQSYRHVDLIMQFLRSRQDERVWADTQALSQR
eukprot:SAG11_NODE_31791_length_289_cov_0.757895_1_plen_96_part_11